MAACRAHAFILASGVGKLKMKSKHTLLGWQVAPFPGPTQGIFNAVLTCRGDYPLHGACCRVPTEASGPVCADDVPATACPCGCWTANVPCADEPFDPPCSTAPCYFESNSLQRRPIRVYVFSVPPCQGGLRTYPNNEPSWLRAGESPRLAPVFGLV